MSANDPQRTSGDETIPSNDLVGSGMDAQALETLQNDCVPSF